MKKLYLYLFLFLSFMNISNQRNFCEDITLKSNNRYQPRVISVSDTNSDGNYEFVVTGFGFNKYFVQLD